MKGDVIELYDGNVRVVMGTLSKEQLADAVKRFIVNVEREKYEKEQKELIRIQQKKMVANN